MANLPNPMTLLSSREKRAVSAFLRDFPGEKLLLFGSKARGDSKKGSDIDLLAVVKNKKAEEGIYKNVARILSLFDVYLSVKIFPRKEFERLVFLKTPFMENVSREGIILWPKV